MWCVAVLCLAVQHPARAADLDPPARPAVSHRRPAPPATLAAHDDWTLAFQLRGGIFPEGLDRPSQSALPVSDITPARMASPKGL
jgi:hypothetical protein